MTKTIEVTLYQFDELSDKAKERARNNYCEHWMDHEWWDCTYDMMKEEGEHKHGFNIKDIRFSGFWSQGDGASWAGAVNVKDWIMSKPTTYQEHPTTQIVLALIDEGWIDNIVLVTFGTWHYCHEYNMSIGDISCTEPISDEEMQFGMFKGAQVGELIKIVDAPQGALYDMSKEIEEDCRAFARTIYRELEADYYSQTTEEAIAEMYAINDVWFDETGAIA